MSACTEQLAGLDPWHRSRNYPDWLHLITDRRPMIRHGGSRLGDHDPHSHWQTRHRRADGDPPRGTLTSMPIQMAYLMMQIVPRRSSPAGSRLTRRILPPHRRGDAHRHRLLQMTHRGLNPRRARRGTLHQRCTDHREWAHSLTLCNLKQFISNKKNGTR